MAPKKCAQCAEPQDGANAFCVFCGSKLESETTVPADDHRFCGACGTPIGPGNNFCVNCGAPKRGAEIRVQTRPSAPLKTETKKSGLSSKRGVIDFKRRILDLRKRFETKRPSTGTIISALFLIAFFASIFLLVPSSNDPSNENSREALQSFSSCDELRVEYPGGVGLAGSKNRGGFLAKDWEKDDAVFSAFAALDIDGDRIACELEVEIYRLLPCERQAANYGDALRAFRELAEEFETHLLDFPSAEAVSAADSWDIRNQFAERFRVMGEVERPNDAFAYQAVEDLVGEYFNAWGSISLGYSTGNNDMRVDSAGEVEEIKGRLATTIRVAQSLEATLLPRC